MDQDLTIIHYPDPRLKKASATVEVFDESLRAMAARMLDLMKEARGVGLAAPQVGRNIRMFVMNPTGQPEDARVYVNPELSEAEGEEFAEEGCLSIPGLNVEVARSAKIRLKAQDLDGKPVDEHLTSFMARIVQHEFDHLNGVMIIDRMGSVAKMTNRRLLKDLEQKYTGPKK